MSRKGDLIKFRYFLQPMFWIMLLVSISACSPLSATIAQDNPPVLVEKQEIQTPIEIVFVHAVEQEDGTWTFDVTLKHEDTGWEDYADGWDVVLPDGTVIKPDPDSPFTRLLLHPHETEQPFTRSQGGIVIAPEITFVTVRAHDLVDGFGGREVIVDFMSGGGTDYEVKRLLD